MEDQFQLLFDKMKNEMQKQIMELKDSITNSILERMDDKLQPIIEENKNLKTTLETLENEIESLKRGKKQNNLLIFGVKEDEKSTQELLQKVRKIFITDLHIHLEEYEVNKIYRIGKEKSNDKPRPILFSFVNEWKKNEIIKVKKNLKDVYITEDYTKAVLEKRKLLQAQLKEERRKGNIAYLKFDKIIIRENNNNTFNDKRKREMSSSPQDNTQPKKQQTLKPSTNNRLNAYDLMRFKTNSPSSSTTANKQ